MKLAEIFIPINDNNGNPFPSLHYKTIEKDLVDQFGGVTAFSRAPAKGQWKEDDNQPASKDDIIIFEVMMNDPDKGWWKNYQSYLKEVFQQDEILIRFSDVEIL